MTSNSHRSATTPTGLRRQWTAPTVQQLPPLVELTLSTGNAIGASCGPSGCVFSVLTGKGVSVG